MKFLKFSEILREAINDLISVGVGIRSKDSEGGRQNDAFEMWDRYIQDNVAFKLDSTGLKRDQMDVYYTDANMENLGFVVVFGRILEVG